MEYKGYEIANKANEWEYFEAFSIDDCDAPMIFAKTLEQLIIDIEEL